VQEEAQAATDALDPKHTWVPWVTVDGAPINAQQLGQASQLAQRVCEAFNGTKCALLLLARHCRCMPVAFVKFRPVVPAWPLEACFPVDSGHYTMRQDVCLRKDACCKGFSCAQTFEGPEELVLSLLLQAKCMRRHLTMDRCVQAASMRAMTERARCVRDCCMMYTSSS
jgi:hypothetical protein